MRRPPQSVVYYIIFFPKKQEVFLKNANILYFFCFEGFWTRIVAGFCEFLAEKGQKSPASKEAGRDIGSGLGFGDVTVGAVNGVVAGAVK